MQVTLLSRDGELWKVTGGLKSYCNDTWIFGSGTETERERERDACEKKTAKKKRFATTGVLEQAPIIVHCTRSQANVCLSSYSFGDGSYWGTLILQRTYQMLAWSAWSRFRSPAVLRSFFFSVFITGRIGRDGKTQPIWRLATSWTVRCSNTGGSKRVSALYTLLNQLWVPSNFLFNGYQRTALGVNRQGRGFGHPPPSSAEVMNEWSCVVGSKSFLPDIKSRAKWKMLWGIYSVIYDEVNVSVGKCVEMKGDYVEK